MEDAARRIHTPPGAFVVADPAMVRLYGLVERLAPSSLPVLITGETGCGKEVIATAIHARSLRAAKPMTAINCAALHETLVESELFGHDKGSFTGAVAARGGLIEAASGSTLFLDEVGELAPAAQAKLLRVLESRRVTRIGEVRERVVDVRVIAATNRDIEAEVASGRFRRDLYYRMQVVTLHLPPLRERPSELALLAEGFLAEACQGNGRPRMEVSEGALAVLRVHAWPGNIRELKNLMQYLAATVTGTAVLAEHVMGQLGKAAGFPGTEAHAPETLAVPAVSRDPSGKRKRSFRALADELRELEITRIREALDETGGNQTHAAALLAIPVRTFFAKAKSYGLTRRKKAAP
jgi:two-component system response regulator AtoC